MKNIVYIGKYNGIIGGIERYMQNSAALLRRNGFFVHYLYTENGGKEQENFAGAFDSTGYFSPETIPQGMYWRIRPNNTSPGEKRELTYSITFKEFSISPGSIKWRMITPRLSMPSSSNSKLPT